MHLPTAAPVRPARGGGEWTWPPGMFDAEFLDRPPFTIVVSRHY